PGTFLRDSRPRVRKEIRGEESCASAAEFPPASDRVARDLGRLAARSALDRVASLAILAVSTRERPRRRLAHDLGRIERQRAEPSAPARIGGPVPEDDRRVPREPRALRSLERRSVELIRQRLSGLDPLDETSSLDRRVRAEPLREVSGGPAPGAHLGAHVAAERPRAEPPPELAREPPP